MQSTYLCVILHVKHRKRLVFSGRFFLIYLISNSGYNPYMANMFGDVTGFQQGHHP